MIAYKIKDEFLESLLQDFNKLKGVCSFSEYLYYMSGIILNNEMYKYFLENNNIILVGFTPNEKDAFRICEAYLFNSYKELDNEQQSE